MNMLDYPFNSTDIMKRKSAYKRQFLSQSDFVERRIAILSGSTIGDIATVLSLFLMDLGIKPTFYIGQFNRFYEEAMFNDQSLIDFEPELVCIHTTMRNLCDNSIMQKLQVVWHKIHKVFSCPVIQNNFELPAYEFKIDSYTVNEMNKQISDYAKQNKYLYIHNIQHLAAWYGLDKWFNDKDYYLYKYAFSVDAIPTYCHNLARVISSIYGISYKCLVLDLDNTLWGGVVGDVGVMGIELGMETALGESYTAFQRYVKSLHSKGVVLAVCSKNDMHIAKEAFNNPNMLLNIEDFAVFCANWNNKADNILNIAEQLNILPKSMVFIDDNPAERELVRDAWPGIKVPEANSPNDFIHHLERAGYFNTVNLTSEDLNRNSYYTANAKRNEAKKAYLDYGDYLSSLQMSCEIKPFTTTCFERITQLINKTNQFNLTTKRYSISEVKKITYDKNYIASFATLSDKFGDNGIVSVFIGEVDKTSLHVRLWVMSCRVFNRDLEYAMFDYVVDACKQRDINMIVGYYIKSAANGYVSDLFANLGFSKNENAAWEYTVPMNYQCKNKYIYVAKDYIKL